MHAKEAPCSHALIDNRHWHTPGMANIAQFRTLYRTMRHQFGTPPGKFDQPLLGTHYGNNC